MSQGKAEKSKRKAKEAKTAESAGKASTSQMIVPVILVFMMVSAGFFVLFSNPDEDGATNPQPDTDVTVVIDYGDGTVDWYNVTIDDATAFVALQAAAEEDDFDIEYDEYSTGILLTSINSQANDDTAGLYWLCYVNDEMGMASIDTTDIEDGDVVKLSYEVSPWA